MEHNIIMILARWASAVILQYLKDVPLEVLTDKYRQSRPAEGRKALVEDGAPSSKGQDKIIKKFSEHIFKGLKAMQK